MLIFVLALFEVDETGNNVKITKQYEAEIAPLFIKWQGRDFSICFADYANKIYYYNQIDLKDCITLD